MLQCLKRRRPCASTATISPSTVACSAFRRSPAAATVGYIRLTSFSVPRADLHLGTVFDDQRSITIELQLVDPVVAQRRSLRRARGTDDFGQPGPTARSASADRRERSTEEVRYVVRPTARWDLSSCSQACRRLPRDRRKRCECSAHCTARRRARSPAPRSRDSALDSRGPFIGLSRRKHRDRAADAQSAWAGRGAVPLFRGTPRRSRDMATRLLPVLVRHPKVDARDDASCHGVSFAECLRTDLARECA